MTGNVLNTKKIRLDLAYHGRAFLGWQKQTTGRTVQGELENALSRLFEREVQVFGAGRTDSGAHARQQVCHFDLPGEYPLTQLMKALNGMTHRSLKILSATHAPEDFHARYTPHVKTYCYRIDAAFFPDPFTPDLYYHSPGPLPLRLEAEKFLEAVSGTHDFASFCSAENSTETTVRRIISARLQEEAGDKWIFTLVGNGFLQHMVRIIAGTALMIGRGKLEARTAISALDRGGGRLLLGPTLPARGLCLEKVEYFFSAPSPGERREP